MLAGGTLGQALPRELRVEPVRALLGNVAPLARPALDVRPVAGAVLAALDGTGAAPGAGDAVRAAPQNAAAP